MLAVNASYGKDFYPRSPRGERQKALTKEALSFEISIHAPREGSDGKAVSAPGAPIFLSTLPARGATCREEGQDPAGQDFYPRSPRGERPAPMRTGAHN